MKNCTFHHIGYTVEDIPSAVGQFAAWGYEASEPVYDEALTVDLCYLNKPGCPTIELVHQRNEASLETKLLEKVGNMPYHIGYLTEDIEAVCRELDSLGYKRLFDPVPVKALGGTLICYYHHPALGYIEILEQPHL